MSEDQTPDMSLPLVHRTFDDNLHMEPKDFEYIDVVIACALDRDLLGEPLWMEIIGPAGAMKSVLLRAVSAYDRCYTLDTLTTNTFISGLPDADGNPMGILQDLDGKVVVMSDFGVILSRPKPERYAIFGQFRQIYDGMFEKATGNMREKTTVHSKIGLILGCTPYIDAHQQIQTQLGERFLKIRQQPDRELVTRRAMQNHSQEERINTELAYMIKSLLENASCRIRQNPDIVLEPTLEQTEVLFRLAMYVSYMRAWVHIKTTRNNDDVLDMDVAAPEIPGRVVKQLMKLLQALAIIRGHDTITEEDMNTIRRVVRDTSIPKRQIIVSALMGNLNDETPIKSIVKISHLHYNSVRLEMWKCKGLGIIDYREEIEYGEPVFSTREQDYVQPKKGTTYFLKLSSEFEEFANATLVKEVLA